jgi:putative NIF3 family GTP cyclohydrolase 1 type 2
MAHLSRREFVQLTAAGVAASPFGAGAAAPTAQEIVDRIKARLGVTWQASTVDTFKAGDPSTVVTGVVTTSLATIDILRRAVKSGANMVVTSGPTFYSRADSPTPPAGRGRGASPQPVDPVFAAKNELIRANKLVVWRLSDHWRLRSPDPFVEGLTATLGFASVASGAGPRHVTVGATTLDGVSTRVKARLNARGGLRVIGNPRTRVRTIALLPGTVPIQTMLTVLPQVDAVIAGEIREWESSEYARDMVTSGRDKGLILIGRTLSEEPGMKVCAQWLEQLVPEARVRWMPAGDPFWRPAASPLEGGAA